MLQVVHFMDLSNDRPGPRGPAQEAARAGAGPILRAEGQKNGPVPLRTTVDTRTPTGSRRVLERVILKGVACTHL